MRAIAEACADGCVEADVRVVISPLDETPATVWARERGLNVRIVPRDEDQAAGFLAALAGVEILCLAGFLRILPSEVLLSLPGRVLNIHPALLPKFGGKGMYGMHVHEAVIAAGETESGCTVHRVSEVYDEGPIVYQLRCPVLPGDSAEDLAHRVLELEHKAYPEAIQRVIDGRA
jgi:phosphoribosylglycinamide formyltransferase-1